MRVVFAGTPEVAVPSLAALVESDHEVVAVVTRPDAAKGRSKKLVPSPVGLYASDHQIPVLRPDHPRDAAFQRELAGFAPHVVPVVAYGALVPPNALAIPVHGWVNLHFSLLPAWRGAAPVQRALMAGAQVTGVTTFQITEGLDSGPIYRQLQVEVGDDVTAGDVLGDLAVRGAVTLLETLDAIGNGAVADPQPSDGVSVAPKLTVDEARIDWNRSAQRAHNHIRGCSPHPGAWTTFAEQRFKVLRTRLCPQINDLAPGHVHITGSTVLVGTGTSAIELVEVQPLGKRPMDASSWGNGVRVEQPCLV